MTIISKTSPETELLHYHVADENIQIMDEQFALAIKDIMEK